MDKEILIKIRPGMKVKIWEKIKEGDKERLSPFAGMVIARKHGMEAGGTFTVRTVLQEVGVENVFPIHSPNIAKIEIIATPKKVRRSKLYYLRDLSAKKARRKIKTTVEQEKK
jgi:large subunit ribosomal protein L19